MNDLAEVCLRKMSGKILGKKRIELGSRAAVEVFADLLSGNMRAEHQIAVCPGQPGWPVISGNIGVSQATCQPIGHRIGGLRLGHERTDFLRRRFPVTRIRLRRRFGGKRRRVIAGRARCTKRNQGQ
jgi:hypothetical protein